MCKHNPCKDKHIIQRAYRFLFDKASLIDRKSWTGTCSQCGELIDAPNLSAYWFIMFLGLGIYRGALHIALKLLKLNIVGLDLMLIGAYLVLFVWFVPSLLLAFGKWKAAPKGDLSESEYVTNRANELAKSRRTPRFRLKAAALIILSLAFICLGKYLSSLV